MNEISDSDLEQFLPYEKTRRFHGKLKFDDDLTLKVQLRLTVRRNGHWNFFFKSWVLHGDAHSLDQITITVVGQDFSVPKSIAKSGNGWWIILEEGLPAHKGIQISPPADELPTHVTIQNQEVKLAPVPKQTPKPTGRKQSNEEEPSELKGIHTVFTTPEN